MEWSQEESADLRRAKKRSSGPASACIGVEVVVVAAGSYMADVGGLRYRERLKGQLMTSEQPTAEPLMPAVEHSEQPVIEIKPKPSKGAPKWETETRERLRGLSPPSNTVSENYTRQFRSSGGEYGTGLRFRRGPRG